MFCILLRKYGQGAMHKKAMEHKSNGTTKVVKQRKYEEKEGRKGHKIYRKGR